MREFISHLFRSLFTPTTGRGPAPRRKTGTNHRPTLEALETRETPTVTTSGTAADFHIDIDAGEKVDVGRTDNFKLRVTVDGTDLPVQQAASSIEKLTITATNNSANPIDLNGINLADFTSLTQVLVKIDARDTVTRGAGWNPAGPETIDGQRFAVFTQGNATLKITDLTSPPAVTPTPQARGIGASLIRKRVHGKVKLLVQVSFADTGEKKRTFPSPLQQPGVHVSVTDTNGDGIADTVVLTASKKGQSIIRQFAG